MKITYSQIREAHPEPYPMSLVGSTARAVMTAVNQGIDSHLEACYIRERGDSYDARTVFVGGKPFVNRLECAVSSESLPVLLRRLSEMDDLDDDSDTLVSDILETIGIDVESACFTIIPDNELPTCDDCGAELETCCDGIERCLECKPCPACYDGGGPI